MASLIDEGATHMETVEEAQLARPAFPGPMDDYNELLIQYGFIVLFAPAFPLAALLGWLNNIFRLKVNGYKLCAMHRRPIYQCAEDIGSWMLVLQAVSSTAILSNAVIIAYSCPSLSDYHMFQIFGPSKDDVFLARLAVCLLCEHVMLFIRFLVQEAISDITDHVKDERKKRAYVKACEEARHLRAQYDENLEYIFRQRANEAPDRYEHHVDDI